LYVEWIHLFLDQLQCRNE